MNYLKLFKLSLLILPLITFFSVTSNAQEETVNQSNTIEEIIDVVEKSKPELLTMSISHKFDLVTSEKLLNSLRKKIDTKTKIVIGGKGSPCTVQGVSYFHTFANWSIVFFIL